MQMWRKSEGQDGSYFTCEAGISSSIHPFAVKACSSSHTLMSWSSLKSLKGFSAAAGLVPGKRSFSRRSTFYIRGKTAKEFSQWKFRNKIVSRVSFLPALYIDSGPPFSHFTRPWEGAGIHLFASVQSLGVGGEGLLPYVELNLILSALLAKAKQEKKIDFVSQLSVVIKLQWYPLICLHFLKWRKNNRFGSFRKASVQCCVISQNKSRLLFQPIKGKTKTWGVCFLRRFLSTRFLREVSLRDPYFFNISC